MSSHEQRFSDSVQRESPPRNKLLAALPSEEYRRIEPQLTLVPLRHRQVLHRAGQPIHAVYFPADGLCSIVMTMEDGRAAEVATVGNEGIVGLSAFLGQEAAPGDTIVQIPGAFAYMMPAEIFAQEMERCGPLHDLVNRYSQALVAYLMHSAACNGLHAADQRCARWLLQSHDRIGRDWFELTQEFLAVMLGVRRATVSVIAQQLQRAGLIVFRRRGVRILDRQGLEAITCECYGAIKSQFDRLFPEYGPGPIPT
jgi:CRP-like cAMP-binding protein